MDAGDLLSDAERAIAARDLTRAIALLERAVEASPDDLTLWMKIAALRRGTGDARGSLDAVHRALALSPRDFTALLMRASLFQRLDDPRAGDAWGNALAQRPEKDLPPELVPVVAEAEQRHSAWLGAREEQMKRAMAAFEEGTDAEQRKRIERFRTNVLRRTRPFHSEPTDFHFPELTEREFHPRRLFPWIDRLEAATEMIREELRAVMAAERSELVPYVQYDEHLPLDQWKQLNKNLDWTAIHLLLKGRTVQANARHCPQTVKLLASFPQPAITGAVPNAMFSLLAPHTQIPPHVGVGNFRLVCHLPLIVPEGCWFRVGAETRHWRPGEAFVFDDTIEHEALNPTDELRIVFIFDVWHPDLCEVERDAIKALIESDDAPAGGGL
jgi:aspartyl/asparaginyl beta-hydroxylase (cupin superfamily)